MSAFRQWFEARIPKPKVLDKASAYSTYRLPKSQLPYNMRTPDQLLQAFEAGENVPMPIIGDALEEVGHPNATFFRSPEMMAKAHFYMMLPGHNWNDPGSNEFKNYIIHRYNDLFNGAYKPNYRSIKGQQNHGQYVSFLHDLIHNPHRIPNKLMPNV